MATDYDAPRRTESDDVSEDSLEELKARRNEAQSAVVDVDEGDTVVVWRIDRLGRSLIDVLNTVNLLREQGVKIRSLSDGIDPETTSGRLMLGMLATLAEYERELITERVNAGIAAAKQSGTRFGRPPVDPAVIAEKLDIARDARAKGRTAEEAARPQLTPERISTILHGPGWRDMTVQEHDITEL